MLRALTVVAVSVRGQRVLGILTLAKFLEKCKLRFVNCLNRPEFRFVAKYFREYQSTQQSEMGVGGAVAAGVFGAAAVGLTALTVPFVSPAFRRVCIPYVPASDQQLINVRSLLERCPQPLRRLIDLGSGDGRVVGEISCRGR